MAINVKKLRIGNVVSANGVITTVRSLGEESVNYPMENWTTPDKIDQLRIAPDMLFSFKFERLDRGEALTLNRYYFKHACGMQLEIAPNGNLYLPGHETYPLSNITQVQNIAMDLFNYDFVVEIEPEALKSKLILPNQN